MPQEIYQVYVQIDAQSRITRVNSSAFLTDLTDWIQIDEGEGDKYHHAQGNYFPPRSREDSGIPRYKLVDGKVIERTAEEIAADIAAIPPPPPSDHELMMVLLGVE